MLGFLNVPILRRVAFHARRIGSQVDRHFFTTLLTAVLGFVAVATLLVALFEDKFTVAGIGATLYWAVTTVIGSGDPSYVTSRRRLHRRAGCSRSSAWPWWRP